MLFLYLGRDLDVDDVIEVVFLVLIRYELRGLFRRALLTSGGGGSRWRDRRSFPLVR